MSIHDFLPLEPDDIDEASLSIIAIVQAVADLRSLPMDQDVRLNFLERLKAAMTQYAELLSEPQQVDLFQFYEAIEQTIEAHRALFPEIHTPFLKIP